MERKRALVVDSSSFTRGILRAELESAGFEVFEAGDGQYALDSAAKILPDVIAMDVNLPTMSGYEVVKKIRSELRLQSPSQEIQVPVIFVTSNDSLGDRQRGVEAGATDFVVKPFLKGELANLVSVLLNPDQDLSASRILVAEASSMTREIIKDALDSKGIEIIVAENGARALEIFRKEEDSIDLILTDFNMPEMNGDELCRQIRNILGNKSIPIIMLSDALETDAIIKMFTAGVSDYMVKPFVKDELYARLKSHLDTRRLNKELLRQVLEYKRLIKLKDDILSVTSHDLRSPLNGILGFTKLLLEESQTETNVEYLNHIKKSGDFLLSMINDILDLGRTQSENHELDMCLVSIDAIIAEAVATVQHMATPKNIEVQFINQYSETPAILGDHQALLRIINNLLTNAIKFSNKDGNVKIIVLPEDANNVKIQVVDDGIGIPADKINGLFDKFTKASRPGTSGEKSTGLGMAITKGLVERHRGAISVVSEENMGSCFDVILPVITTENPDKDKTADSISQPATPAADRDIRVLVVDDNELNIKLAEKMLSKRGYDVDSAMNGQQAFEKYIKIMNSDEPRFNAIFMDVRMPVMDGFEATDKIRMYETVNHYAEIPIIAMTAGTDEFWRERCIEMGMSGTIKKPIDQNQINEVEDQFF